MHRHVSLGRDIYDAFGRGAQVARRDGRREISSGLVFYEIVRGRSLGRRGIPGSVRTDLGAAFVGVKAPEGPDIAIAATGDELGWTKAEVDAMLREIIWRECGAFPRSGETDPGDYGVSWHDSVVWALARALAEARSARVSQAGGVHLLLGLTHEPDGVAARLLRERGLDRDGLIGRLRSDPMWSVEADPHAPMVTMLEMYGGVVAAMPWLVRWVPPLMRRGAAKRSRYGGTVAHCLEYEIVRQAVRMNSPIITSAHGVLAVASLAEQLASTGRRLYGRTMSVNAAVHALPEYRRLLAIAETESSQAVEETDGLSRVEANEVFWVQGPPWGRRLARALAGAITFAHGLGHREVGTSHLLVTLLGDETSAAYRLVAASGADAEAMRARLAATLRPGRTV